MLDTGCWMLDARYWMLDTGCSILDAGCSMLDTGFLMPDAGCWMRILDVKPDLRLLAAGHLSLVTCHLSLMTDHWPLVTLSGFSAFWPPSFPASRPPGLLASIIFNFSFLDIQQYAS
jgi:hypothetical protein